MPAPMITYLLWAGTVMSVSVTSVSVISVSVVGSIVGASSGIIAV